MPLVAPPLLITAHSHARCFALHSQNSQDQFNKIRANKDGSATMTTSQKQWVETMKAIGSMAEGGGISQGAKVKPTPGEGIVGRVLFRVANSSAFQRLMTLMIVLSILVLCSDRWGLREAVGVSYTHETYTALLSAFNYIFYAEAVLKVSAFGPTYYLRDEWSRFEGGLVVLALINQSRILELLPLPPVLQRSFEASRALRALRLVQHASGLFNLVKTILLSLPSLINVTSLLALVVFIYSCAGVQFFTFVQRGVFFTDQRNFDSFGHARKCDEIPTCALSAAC